ncbi:MAG: hypothetical protein K2M46_12405 [Lachnospiraceae bacterium]|nr:hypothetical protein [Lachnospiraceae bacterium]
MDITPIYELQSRLRSAAIAGSNLLSEDFRLQRAAKDMQSLAKASPVFQKISGLMERLMAAKEEERAGALLETLTLVDAVLCTMAAVEVPKDAEPEKIKHTEQSSVIANAPYSSLSTLIEALTTSGSGHYNQVWEAKMTHPELFQDYRVKHAMVQALGASYGELAEMVMEWMIEEQDISLLPILKEDFDPKGNKAMVRRVWVIEALGGEKENAFYMENLPESEKDVRKALLFALRHHRENTSLLLDLVKTERGAAKKAAIRALAFQEGQEVEEFFQNLAKKKPLDALEYLEGVTSQWASDFTADVLMKAMEEDREALDKGLKAGSSQTSNVRGFSHCLLGKSGERIAEFYRQVTSSKEMARSMLESYICTKDRYLRDAAMDILKQEEKRDHIDCYYGVVVMSKLLEEEDVHNWLAKELSEKESFGFQSISVKKRVMADAFSYIKFTGGKYQLEISYFDNDANQWVEQWFDCQEQITEKVVDTLMEYPCEQFDKILYQWLDENNASMCEKLKPWFMQRAIQHPNRDYLKYLDKCKADYIPGLARDYVKKNPQVRTWELQMFLGEMPGTYQQKAEEAKLILEYLENEKEKRDISQQYLNNWIETWSQP